MISYLALFGSALIAATILPLQSEAVLVALLVAGDHSAAALVLVATAGNVLGSLINWIIGRHLLRFQGRRWFPASPAQLARAQDWYGRYGRWSLLGSWLPLVGDPLTLVAGVLREPIWSFLLLAALTLSWL